MKRRMPLGGQRHFLIHHCEQFYGGVLLVMLLRLFLPLSCLPLGQRTGDFRGTCKEKMSAGAVLADIDPMAIDQSVRLNIKYGLP